MTAPAKIDIASSHRARIGCSSIAQALGVSRWGTPYQLWERYTGRAPWPDICGELRVALGEPMEDVLRPFIEQRLGCELRRDRKEYLHPNLPLIGHVDFRANVLAQAVIDALGRPALKRPVVDCKTSLGWRSRVRFGAVSTLRSIWIRRMSGSFSSPTILDDDLGKIETQAAYATLNLITEPILADAGQHFSLMIYNGGASHIHPWKHTLNFVRVALAARQMIRQTTPVTARQALASDPTRQAPGLRALTPSKAQK